MRRLLCASMLWAAAATWAADSQPVYLSWEVRQNEQPMMAGKLKAVDGKPMTFPSADDLQVRVTARAVDDAAADVRFSFSRPDGSELFGRSPRLLAAWGQLARIAVVDGAGERYELVLTASREPQDTAPAR